MKQKNKERKEVKKKCPMCHGTKVVNRQPFGDAGICPFCMGTGYDTEPLSGVIKTEWKPL